MLLSKRRSIFFAQQRAQSIVFPTKNQAKYVKKIIDSEKIKSNAAKAEKLSNCPTGTRQFWQTEKSVKNNFTSSSLPPLKSNGKLVSKAEEKANTLAANSTRDSSNSEKPTKMPSFKQSKNAFIFRSCIVNKYLQEQDAKKKPLGPMGFHR